VWTPHSAETAVHPIKRNGSAHAPAERTSASELRTQTAIQIKLQATAVRSNISPDRDTACIVTASLRATATAARLKPTRSLNLSAHVPVCFHLKLRVRITVAAS
jgi:hypothetical protein